MDAKPLDFDAVILAGGRSVRLGGVPKQSMTYDGDTLLHRAVAAAGGARAVVVVGAGLGNLPAGILSCREEPPFSGPAAAIAAGLATLQTTGGSSARMTLVLACDMPNVRPAVAALRKALEAGGTAATPDGVVAVSEDGRRQQLVAFYSTDALQRSVAELAAKGSLINGSVRSLLASLDVQPVAVPAGSTADVDTWDDAAALGVAGPEPLSGFRSSAAADDLGGRA
ncbi:NTP transferase domain-containing protein [Pseudarthrobacter sulfonivorans]|uniref:NTP transferase domain-containing protein n=1 Tax=Pseudarthrobacter sulfonivorans TaxID=121292 RepID=UPI00285C73CB|nr:NTP transferase domain-containing protein [Pseudarthrobacter sulfonivorans]MDR6417324.1 molybdopterin-guanine dinucleotide biosynthesis protein A [Pseudarthrobacter sulfonivorans]